MSDLFGGHPHFLHLNGLVHDRFFLRPQPEKLSRDLQIQFNAFYDFLFSHLQLIVCLIFVHRPQRLVCVMLNEHMARPIEHSINNLSKVLIWQISVIASTPHKVMPLLPAIRDDVGLT